MSTTLRLAYLRALRACGMRSIVATSGLGHPFVCHLGDFFGEYPYYTRHAFEPELEMCAAWLQDETHAVVLDVGANVGFWSTQLAQMTGTASIYAFEPVPATFCKLANSVERLALESRVFPICAALSDRSQVIRLSVDSRASGFAQVSDGALNPRVGNRLASAIAMRLDEFATSLAAPPSLVKVDVEGSEIRVLQGAGGVLAGDAPPALLFEFNPTTLRELGESAESFGGLLSRYALYYVDDFEGQKREFGSPVADLKELSWVCNIFGVPSTPEARTRFSDARARAAARMGKRR